MVYATFLLIYAVIGGAQENGGKIAGLKGGVIADSVESASSRTATIITGRQFDSVPKGRTFNSLLLMAPGVRVEPKNGMAGVGGTRG